MKELDNLTLENVQVDCRGLTENKIREIAEIYTKNGFNVNYYNLNTSPRFYYFPFFEDNILCTYAKDERKTTITYKKFMELFTPNYGVTMIAEQPKENSQSITDEALLNHIPDVGKKAERPSISNPKKKWDNMPNESDYSEQPTAYKETSNKLNYELDFNFITQMAERMAKNKHKYEPYNWHKLDNIEDLKQALLRHVLDVLKGNYEDSDRMFGHLEAIALNAMFINYQLNKNGKI